MFLEKKIQVGVTKGFLFFIGNFFGKKKLVTSLLIERQIMQKKTGSWCSREQCLNRSATAPWLFEVAFFLNIKNGQKR